MKRLLISLGSSFALLAIWLGMLFILGGVSNIIFSRPPKFSVLSQLVISALLTCAIFPLIFRRYAWVAQWALRVNLSGLALGLLAGIFVVAAALLLSYAGGSYMLPCTTCGSLPDYVDLFSTGFAIGTAEEIWHSGIFLSALLILFRQNTWLAIIAASLLFMRFHSFELRSDVVHALRLVLAGAVFSTVTITFKSIWPSAALHGMLDALIKVLLEGAPGVNPVFAAASDAPAITQVVPLGAILLSCAIYQIRAAKRVRLAGEPDPSC